MSISQTDFARSRLDVSPRPPPSDLPSYLFDTQLLYPHILPLLIPLIMPFPLSYHHDHSFSPYPPPPPPPPPPHPPPLDMHALRLLLNCQSLILRRPATGIKQPSASLVIRLSRVGYRSFFSMSPPAPAHFARGVRWATVGRGGLGNRIVDERGHENDRSPSRHARTSRRLRS